MVLGLAKVAIFTTNFDAVNQPLINHKCACRGRNRHFMPLLVLPFFLCVTPSESPLRVL